MSKGLINRFLDFPSTHGQEADGQIQGVKCLPAHFASVNGHP
jgi:hypothetical protein